jgi:hydrogenase maturation protease
VTCHIVGVGEPTAGDDGVGLAVVERLRSLPLPAGLDVCSLRDPSALAGLLTRPGRTLVIDALLDSERVGEVRFLAPAELFGESRARAISSHGVDTLLAIALARALAEREPPEVSVLTIAIGPPTKFCVELSGRVAEAIEPATQAALGWVLGSENPQRLGEPGG